MRNIFKCIFNAINRHERSGYVHAFNNVWPKISCFFENLAINCFTLTALHSADKCSNEQQILEILFTISTFYYSFSFLSCKVRVGGFFIACIYFTPSGHGLLQRNSKGINEVILTKSVQADAND